VPCPVIHGPFPSFWTWGSRPLRAYHFVSFESFVVSTVVFRLKDYSQTLRTRAADKLSQRLGWMTRAHPIVLDGQRLIVPLYADGFNGSLMARTLPHRRPAQEH